MTETKCPTCGGKVAQTSFTNGTGGNVLYNQFKSLPSPDLTKLREAYAVLNEISNNTNFVGLNRFSGMTKQIAVVLSTIKEVLDEQRRWKKI